MYKELAVTVLAGVAWAQSSMDLITVLNGTEGTAVLAGVLAELPQALETIAGKTNLTLLAPNDTAILSLQNSSRAEAFELGGEDYLLNTVLYHFIDGGYDNISDYAVVHTLLTSSTYTSVSGGQYVGLFYDDDENVIGAYGGLDLHPEGQNHAIAFSQGWIYIVDDILEIPPSFSKTITSRDFNGTSFVEALNKTGLTEQFDTLSDATYLVPVNTAFAAVECTLSQLSNEELAEVLKYHVVQGQVWHFDDFQNGTQLTTLHGQNVTVYSTAADDWFFNNAGLSYTDLSSFSGSIFFIDNVLNPHASWTHAANGTEDGVLAFTACDGDGDSSSNSSTAGVATATYTGAAVPMKAAGLHTAALLGCAAFAVVL